MLKIKRLCQTTAFFAALLLVGQNLSAQQSYPEPCGTKGLTPWFDHYRKHRKPLPEQNADTTWLLVPITLHITGTTAGTGHYPFDQAITSLCITNEKFAPARIRFFLAPDEPIRYLNNTAWHRHDYSAGGEMVSENYLPGRLNAFVVADPAGNCGYSGFGAIVLGQNCSGTGYTTWPHEAGHHFSLPHTFFGWEGYTHNYAQPAPEETDGWPVENADQSNCGWSGDFFCDTRPDYLNTRWNCNVNGESTVLQTDPLGNTFRSDGTLLMSYSDQVCRDRFSPEQIVAMRENLRTEHSDYLQWPTPTPGFSGNSMVALVSPLDSQLVQYNDVTFSWQEVPEATLYYLEVARNANFSPVQYRATVSGTTQHNFNKSLINNNVLHWRVRAYHGNDFCATEQAFQTGVFRTRNLNVSASNLLAEELSLELMGNPIAAGMDAVLQLSAAKRMELVVQVRDAAGRLHSSQPVELAAGENQWSLDTQQLPAGFYFVSLHAASGSMTTTLVIAE